ncbi:MAG: GNAT family N-acetyltransferase [Oricola sp.]
MEAYYGTETQVALQRKVDGSVGWLITTPGACHIGRFFGTDDPDRLGWDTIFRHLEEDGVFGFRLMPVETLPEIEQRLGERGYKIDYWDVFSAKANTIREALRALDSAVPEGYAVLDPEAFEDPDTIRAAQSFMAANSVAPLSGDILTGGHGPSAFVAIAGPDGAIVATAFGYFPHNVHSPHDDSAWGGLVAVDPQHRGRGFGVLANALMLRAMIEERGARTVYELVSATNEPARRMAMRCGLALDESVKSGLASLLGSSKSTP